MNCVEGSILKMSNLHLIHHLHLLHLWIWGDKRFTIYSPTPNGKNGINGIMVLQLCNYVTDIVVMISRVKKTYCII